MQIENEEVIERYIRNRLTPDERRAFEEHYFACDACFAKVQEMERFIAGVREAAENGKPLQPANVATAPGGWLQWALFGSICAAAALAIAVGWLTLSAIPNLRANLNATTAQVQSQQEMIAQLKAVSKAPEAPEGNVPLVMLQAERGSDVTDAVLPSDAKRLVVWIDLGQTHYNSFQIKVYSPSGTLIDTVDHLSRGPYGALAVGLPSDQLQAGIFRIILTGQAPPTASLIGEYRLRIRKP